MLNLSQTLCLSFPLFFYLTKFNISRYAIGKKERMAFAAESRSLFHDTEKGKQVLRA